MSKVVSLSQIFQENTVDFPEKMYPNDISKKKVPQGVEVYEIQGPFFFGAANILRDLLNSISHPPKIFILRMRFIPMIDASGMYGIEEFYSQCKKKGIVLFLSGVHGQTQQDLKKFGLIDSIGEQRIFPDIDLALAKAEEMVSSRGLS
ncbi:MAG: sodium-independent anion transporter [Chlamydiia bacterium]|nr:sodium-independent anion transporter [Chlamydiia bacterium]